MLTNCGTEMYAMNCNRLNKLIFIFYQMYPRRLFMHLVAKQIRIHKHSNRFIFIVSAWHQLNAIRARFSFSVPPQSSTAVHQNVNKISNELHFTLNQFSLTSLQATGNHKKLLSIHRSK